jgi:hypothetical protein
LFLNLQLEFQQRPSRMESIPAEHLCAPVAPQFDEDEMDGCICLAVELLNPWHLLNQSFDWFQQGRFFRKAGASGMATVLSYEREMGLLGDLQDLQTRMTQVAGPCDWDLRG